LIEGTTTKKGLKIKAKIDKKILKEEFNKINIEEHQTNSKMELYDLLKYGNLFYSRHLVNRLNSFTYVK